jgi:phosphate transport system substrate-binding protein
MAVLSFAFPAVVSAAEVIKLGGVGSALGTMRLLSAAFERSHTGIKVVLLSSLGSTGGIKAAASGAIDIGLSGRPLNDEERGQGVIETEYAQSPFVFVTYKNNNVSGLNTGELIDIYKGKRQMWPDGSRIRLVLRPASDIDTKIVSKISPAMGQAVKIALSRPGMIMAITNQESDETVEKTPGAIGASTLTQIISEKRSLKILSFNGVDPSLKNLAQGSYPLVKRFFVVTKPAPPPSAQKFIDYIRSREGRKILEDNGNIAVAGTQGRQ